MERRIIQAVEESEARIMAAIAAQGGNVSAPAPAPANTSAPAPAPAPAPVAAPAPAPAPRPAPAPAPAADDDEVLPTPKNVTRTQSSAGFPNTTEIDIGDKSGWVEDTKAKGGMAGIMVEQSCAKVYNDVRRTKNGLRWGMFKFDKSCSWIIPVAQCAASDSFEQDWTDFVEQLPDDASAYAVYNFDYAEINGRYSDGDSTNIKSRFCLFAWSPKGCGVKQKMLSATSVKAIKEVCKGTVEAAIHDKAECDWDNICSVLRIEAKPISRATFGAHDGW